jgi:hypothetical protein
MIRAARVARQQINQHLDEDAPPPDVPDSTFYFTENILDTLDSHSSTTFSPSHRAN